MGTGSCIDEKKSIKGGINTKTNINKFALFLILLITLIQLVPVCMAEESGPSTWHQFQRDIVHTGFYQSTLPEAYGELWNVSVNAVGDSSPVVAEGKVFVNCADNHLKALNESTGDVEWSTPVDPLQYGSWSSPAYDNGMIFTSTGYNTTCFNATNGSVIWSVRTGASCNGGPMIADGKVFCNDWNDRHYYCLNESDGTELWRFSVIYEKIPHMAYAQGTAAYRDNRVYLTSWDYGATMGGHVYCLNASSGSEIWNSSFQGCACGSATLGDDAIYVTSYNFYGSSKAYCLNMTDGSILWETPIKSTDSTPAFAYGNIYISSGYNGNYKTYCLNASNGSVVWETGGVGGWTNSVAVADGKVFAGIAVKASSTAGYTTLVELDAYTGDILWKATGGSTCAISDGNIYTIYRNGKVYAYTSATPTVDIVTTDVELSTETAYPYYGNEITATIKNGGNKYVNNISVSLKANGIGVDSLILPVVGGVCSQKISFMWTPQESGDYELTVDAHSLDSVTETNSSNNVMSINVTAITGNPDLVPSEITPSGIYANQSYEMKTTITNMGYMGTGAFSVEVKEGTKVLANETISSLDPAWSTDVYFNWTSPSSGNVDLTITVDTENTVTEEDETNNELLQTIVVKPEYPIEVLSNSDWSQFQRDSDQSGITTDYSPRDNFASMKWSADDFNGNIDIPPVVVGDIVYVLSSSGLVYAYDKNDGTPMWHKNTGDNNSIHSATPAYGDRNLFVATYKGNLYAYNSTNGLLRWEVNVTGDSIESPVTYYDHRIYVADGIALDEGTKYYYCYDDMGTLLWKYAIPDTAGFIWNGASVIGDYIVFPTHEGKLISLDRKTGTLMDEISLNSSVSTEISFAISDPGMFRSSIMYNYGYVYTTSEKGQSTGYVWKVGFDEVTGNFSDHGGWRSDQIFSTSTPAVYDGKVYVGQGEHGESGKLICLNDSTGNKIWSYNVTSGVKSSPAISTYYNKPYIYFTSATDNGSLYCLDENGTLVWEYNPPDDIGYILQGAAISDGKAYFGTDGGYLYCVEGDWNPWNDPDSESGHIISLSEVQLAVYYWQYYFPTPATGHIMSLRDIQLMIYYWRHYLPM